MAALCVGTLGFRKQGHNLGMLAGAVSNKSPLSAAAIRTRLNFGSVLRSNFQHALNAYWFSRVKVPTLTMTVFPGARGDECSGGHEAGLVSRKAPLVELIQDTKYETSFLQFRFILEVPSLDDREKGLAPDTFN